MPRSRTCPRLAEQERVGVVHERDRVPREIETGRQRGSQVDAVDRPELVLHQADPARVVEWAGHGARDARALAEHLPRCPDDRVQQLGLARLVR